jgi:hypothetical protein
MFYSRQGKVFLFSTVSRPALGSSSRLSNWYWWLFPPGVKRPRCEPDNSPPFSVEVCDVRIACIILPLLLALPLPSTGSPTPVFPFLVYPASPREPSTLLAWALCFCLRYRPHVSNQNSLLYIFRLEHSTDTGSGPGKVLLV